MILGILGCQQLFIVFLVHLVNTMVTSMDVRNQQLYFNESDTGDQSLKRGCFVVLDCLRWFEGMSCSKRDKWFLGILEAKGECIEKSGVLCLIQRLCPSLIQSGTI